MTGGLLQLVTSGKQDIYLTINPEITFFKKVYRRHTNFSIELKEIAPEQNTDYGELITFIINKQGDAIHRCYLEVDLPLLSFSDKYITNTNYINKKTNDIVNLTNHFNKWTNSYNNLKGYVDIELLLYRTLKIYLQTDNISLNTLKDAVTKFNYVNKKTKDLYKNKIDSNLYSLIDISGYITSINKLLSNTNTDNTIYISVQEINNTIDNMYNKMTEYLSFYNYKINYYNNSIINRKNEYQINFNYANYLGHNYFQSVALEIGGQEYQKYSNDFLHINQQHHIKNEYMPNYYEMIGNIPELNNYDNKPKGNKKILVPLIFWFNKDAGSCLPLIAMQYPTISFNVNINDITKIVSFEDYEKMYYDLLNITIGYETTNTVILNTNLIYSKYNINILEKSITYNTIIINDELLKYKFPDLLPNERNIILTNNGTLYNMNEINTMIDPNYVPVISNNNITQYCINVKQWINFMVNIKNSIYQSFVFKIGSYYPYIDFNLYYSTIPKPNVKLICEYIFFDDVERAMFANSKLEYIIETFSEDIYNISDQQMFSCELSFNNPCKELLWYVQPQIFLDGLTQFGQNTSLIFDSTKYYDSEIVEEQSLIFNQQSVILPNIDNNYYTYLLSYKYLNNILEKGIYYIPFCLYPEETQPSGTINLRQIKGKQFSITISKKFINEYFATNNQQVVNYLNPNKKGLILKFFTKCYDMFIVNKGDCKLMFNIN
jgi:hypothetical protein